MFASWSPSNNCGISTMFYLFNFNLELLAIIAVFYMKETNQIQFSSLLLQPLVPSLRIGHHVQFRPFMQHEVSLHHMSIHHNMSIRKVALTFGPAMSTFYFYLITQSCANMAIMTMNIMTIGESSYLTYIAFNKNTLFYLFWFHTDLAISKTLLASNLNVMGPLFLCCIIFWS